MEKEQQKQPVKVEKQTEQPEGYKKILDKLAEAKKHLKDVYEEMGEEKHERRFWRPLEKEITILFAEFKSTFYFKEHMKIKEIEERQSLERIKQAQEKLK